MADPVETEIKLIARPAMLEALRDHPALRGAETAAVLANTWFDSEQGDLHRAGATLRIRDRGGHREQTLKLASPAGGGVRRREWNAAATSDQPDLALLPAKPRAQLKCLLEDRPLVPVGTAQVRRLEREVGHGGSVISLAFDEGEITAGGRSEPVCELELELRSGRLADVLTMALALPLGPHLQWSVRSKSDRGRALASGTAPPALQAPPIVLDPAMTPAAAFRAIGWSGLGHFLANLQPVIDTGAPVAIHQSRVALRRLRAAIKLFRPVVHDARADLLRDALGTVARGLAPARELHVLHEQLAAAAQARSLDAKELLAHVGVLEAAAAGTARTVLASEECQYLLFEFAHWLEAGDWTVSAAQRPREDTMRAFGSHALCRLRRKLRDRHGALAGMDDARRHRIRLGAKQLRYVVQFLDTVWPSQPGRRRFAAALGRLQDTLGALNDTAVAQAQRGHVLAGLDEARAGRLGHRYDTLMEARAEAEAHLLERAQRSFDLIVSADPWWK
ncbi:MAG: CHAD domain-containing protein [Sphingomonadales bacterium]|nr:CHAD domain-containing protein [Sphingomonadales bacterium]